MAKLHVNEPIVLTATAPARRVQFERFNVSIDGTSLGTCNFDRSGQLQIELPQAKSGTVSLQIGAEGNASTPRISEIRLCR